MLGTWVYSARAAHVAELRKAELRNKTELPNMAQLRRRPMLSSPACQTVGGTYKNANDDLATVVAVTAEAGGASNESRVTLYFRDQGYQPVLSFTYFTPNGYGISTTSDDQRSIYYADLGAWRVGMFGEGRSLWYGEPQIRVSDSLWFQVSCDLDLDAAKQRSLPTISP